MYCPNKFKSFIGQISTFHNLHRINNNSSMIAIHRRWINVCFHSGCQISIHPKTCSCCSNYTFFLETTTKRKFSMSHPNFFEKSFQQLDNIISKVESSLPKEQNQQKKNQKQQQIQQKKPAAPVINYSKNEDIARFQKTNIQVARILDASKLENSEKLLLLKLETIEGQKTLVGGLQQYYKPEEVVGKFVVAILNLRPAKLAGVVSEAMLLAGSTTEDGKTIVKLLEPPQNSNIGDRIFVVENESNLEANILPAVDRVSEKHWKSIVELLQVKGGFATFNGKNLRNIIGDVVCPLPDGSEIH